MSFLYVTEYADFPVDGNGQTEDRAIAPQIAEQAVVNTGASTQSAFFNAATRFVRLATDSICSFSFGTNPTATVASARLPANGGSEYFVVPKGGAYKVAAILNT